MEMILKLPYQHNGLALVGLRATGNRLDRLSSRGPIVRERGLHSPVLRRRPCNAGVYRQPIAGRSNTTVTLGSRHRKSGQTTNQNGAKSFPNLTNSRP